MIANQPVRRIIAVSATGALVGSLLSGGIAVADDQQSVPLYAVVQEGLTGDEGARLARAFETPNAVRANGVFSFADPARFSQVPLTKALRAEKDESGRRVQPQAIDLGALEAIRPVADEEALQYATKLLDVAPLSPELTATPSVSHTELTLTDERNASPQVHALDTVVNVALQLGGLPVTGRGAKLRLTVAPDGGVTQLSYALRKVERSGDVAVIGPKAAAERCAALYGRGVEQDTPTLGYQFPELTAVDANGKGTVGTIFPQYTCNPTGGDTAQAHRLVPAVEDAAPSGKLSARRSGDKVEAALDVSGGTGPYTYAWSSSTTVLGDRGTDHVAYERAARDREDGSETVTVEVTDANGLTATASATLDGDGDTTGGTNPGGGGFGALSVTATDAGTEQTIADWQCAHETVTDFKNVLASHSVPAAFDFRGTSAWESDFKDPSAGGHDDQYIDNVDAAWYIGHGNSAGFTFPSNHDDTWITPNDARWGEKDLEWLQLESCQVLRDTDGTHDYFGRWRQAFAGLHMLNGFHTNAYCVGSTGGSFASYLFPATFLWWQTRPAYRVQSAWASMAVDEEPSGVVYRSMGLIRPDGVTNIGDYFWGQGPTGPDITLQPGTRQWSITGTV